MLDDLHELQSAACHDVLSVVTSGVPRGSQLIAASRSEQPHIPRLRASGDALDFGVSDLALDPAGAEQIFAGAQVALTSEQALAVTERTEGWPVGLYLAALVARDKSGRAATISGDDRYVSDYLYRESLSQLPESDQRFLRRTAMLDQLCAPLCETVLESRAHRGIAQARGFELVPHPARSPARVVPLPRPLSRVPARRASSSGARSHRRTAPESRRLVRVQWISGACRRAPVEHDRTGPLRTDGRATAAADVHGGPDLDG